MTKTSGTMMAHEAPGICHPMGITGVVKMIMATITKRETSIVNQNRLKIRGTSSQNVDFSTSFVVAPHVLNGYLNDRLA